MINSKMWVKKLVRGSKRRLRSKLIGFKIVEMRARGVLYIKTDVLNTGIILKACDS